MKLSKRLTQSEKLNLRGLLQRTSQNPEFRNLYETLSPPECELEISANEYKGGVGHSCVHFGMTRRTTLVRDGACPGWNPVPSGSQESVQATLVGNPTRSMFNFSFKAWQAHGSLQADGSVPK